MTPPRRVAGIDGCRAGWVVALLDDAGRVGGCPGPPGDSGDRPAARWSLRIGVVEHVGEVIADAAAGRLAAVAIDMPIGLAEHGQRACDRAARRLLRERRSSVFPAPARAVLGAGSYAEALERSRAVSGRGISRQSFHLLRRIAEVDRVIQPDLQDRVVEAHPELAFARLAGGRPLPSKRTAAGRAQRLACLAAAGLGDLSTLRRPGAALDDLLDAAVLTLTARRVRDGTAERLGDGGRDARGLSMEIVM